MSRPAKRLALLTPPQGYVNFLLGWGPAAHRPLKAPDEQARWLLTSQRKRPERPRAHRIAPSKQGCPKAATRLAQTVGQACGFLFDTRSASCDRPGRLPDAHLAPLAVALTESAMPFEPSRTPFSLLDRAIAESGAFVAPSVSTARCVTSC